MKKYEVGNFKFTIQNEKWDKRMSNLNIYFKNKKVDSLFAGFKLSKESIKVAANQEVLLVKILKNYEYDLGNMPPIAGYVDDTEYIVNKYSVETGEKIDSQKFRKDKNEMVKAEKVFSDFNQPSLDL